ncbi:MULTISPECIES: response regulator transcription factor [Candidatus Accumulibacter]|uniref:Phosphate regulon transcriptional regulatory protein PhoB n=2 Tax=Candidatus Accumulibacter TaxID=327159 RepID=A0A080MGU4_9PROT|nr:MULTISPECIES: response regulator transcription factor [Candidatus Accumulibacter]KFB76484.1 MAG: Sensory transduction protein regX3 [Candidatus Accumulibacter cognatus]MBL8400568.1 response regulator transcription factor [Accumulibacter sp.]MBN8517229.1 response regulator transcription factor [Accumulibacter sp.]MCC2867145.1 response regulator transcription factor [Candidatus Accumulibacter phosphatis]MCM8580972.1 response regulator transcription factor [Accumulibacter sp.]
MNEQLLLVEDDDAIAAALRLHLEEAGYRLHRESDGLQAMAAIDHQRWDMVLLDLMLPGADGWDVCRHLRAQHPDVPVIMLSARSAEAHRVLGLELGADDYLAKPFSMLELVARVRALLRRIEQLRSSPAPASELRFGPFRLDTLRRELLRGAEAVPLTLREFDLLYFLVRHPGRTFNRGELLQRVWGAAFDGYEHTVNSHINRLRTKIEDDPRDPRRIVTVWGVGYRFEETPA